MRSENKTNNLEKSKKITKFDIFAIMCIVGVIPFLVRGINYTSPFIGADGQQAIVFDYFILIKVNVLKIMALLILINEAYDFFTTERYIMFKLNYKQMFNKKYICAVLILISTVIAFVFSGYKVIALKGTIERFESIWVHFSYIIIFIYSLKFFKKDGAFKVFSYAILLSTFVVGSIGTLQAVGLSPFENELFLKITTPNVNIQVSQPGSFSTMYNTNTSGSYSVFMMYILGLVFILNNDVKIRCASVISFILITITFIFSYSEGSYLAFMGALVVVWITILISLFVKNKKKVAIGLTTITIMTVLVVFVSIFSVDSINTRFTNLVSRAIGEESLFSDWEQDGRDFYFYNREDDFIEVSLLDNNTFELLENDNLLFTSTTDNTDEIISTNNFEDVYINSYVQDDINYINFNNFFSIRNSENPSLVDNESLIELRYVDWIGFEGYNNLFTNRGFIWSRSIPMLLDKPIGYGADNFMMFFPNDDIVGKAFCDWPVGVTADKPHSIYLTMAINNGILYLVSFIALVLIALIEKIRLLKNENKTIDTGTLECGVP